MARSGMLPRNMSVVGPAHSQSEPSPRSASRAFTGRSRTDTRMRSSPAIALVRVYFACYYSNTERTQATNPSLDNRMHHDMHNQNNVECKMQGSYALNVGPREKGRSFVVTSGKTTVMWSVV